MKISKPTLLLDLDKCKKNILKMVEKAKYNNLIFRPHFKTHQSTEIGKIFQEFGVDKITVSSVEMAQYFADDGWRDITIAFPINLLEIAKIENLSGRIDLNVLISSLESAEKLVEISHNSINYFIEIDTGYHRSGISVEDYIQIDKIVSVLNDKHSFKGFLTHAGNTYQAESQEVIIDIHRANIEQMKVLKNEFIDHYPKIITSIGDTPSCTLAENFNDIDEIRPGNFVFYDLMQYKLGVCRFDEIAVCVACPIVDINYDRNQIVIYGGGVHLSKEFFLQNGVKIFGEVVKLNESNWQRSAEPSHLISLSQEHGIIQADDELINKISIGDVVGIIPIHSCMTANLLGSYRTVDNQVFDHK